MIDTVRLINQDTSKNIEIGSDGTGFYVLDTIDFSSPDIQQNTFRVPFQIGETYTSTEVKTREINITGWVIAKRVFVDYGNPEYKEQSHLDEAKQELSEAVNPTNKLRIIVNGFYLEGYPSTSVLFSTNEAENNDIFCKFSITINCLSSMFSKDTGKRTILTSITNLWRFPWILKETGNILSVMTEQKLINVQNNGDIPVGGIIEIVVTDGTITAPVVFNALTLEYIKIDLILHIGDRVVINTNTGEESVVLHHNNGVTESALASVVEGSSFLQFECGSNEYSYRASEGVELFVDITIDITEKYFTIKEQ